MPVIDRIALARELSVAHSRGEGVALAPSARDPEFDLASAYAVEAELVRMRRAEGRKTVGRKIGFANRALWRKFNLETLAWGSMYDDTVHHARDNSASFSLNGLVSPKIEPEIVFTLKASPRPGDADSASILRSVESMALGFEIIDCPFPGWQFQPPDFVAAYGFHAGLVVGQMRRLDPAMIGPLVEQLAEFKLRLLKDGQLVDEGTGKNVLRSPALCLGELATAITRQPGAEPLAAGEIITTGTVTTSQPLRAGEVWRAEVEGIDLPPLTLRV